MRAAKTGRLDPLLLSDQEGAGPVSELEEAFAKAVNAPHALAVSSGTAAIYAALLALEIGRGDEVITTPYSWPQTVSPIYATGASPVFADIDPQTCLLDPESVRACLSPATRAILTVHLFGQVGDMEKLARLAREHGVALIGDAAQLAPSTASATALSSQATFLCFSLGRGKPICAGEGGMLVTEDEELYGSAMAYTQHPDRSRRHLGPGNERTVFGLNYRLHPLIALLALAEFETCEAKWKHRRAVCNAFWEGMGESPQMRQIAGLQDDVLIPYGIPATFCGKGEAAREELCRKAQENGVPLRPGPVKIPLHLAPHREYGRSTRNHSPYASTAHRPITEKRCLQEELWVLSASDMDEVTQEMAWGMGKSLGEVKRN